MAEEENAVNTVGASNSKEGGKTVIIAFDGSDYAKYAMKCELCLLLVTSHFCFSSYTSII
jgi:hypothetical protein